MQLRPLQVTAINSSMCAPSLARTSRWRPSRRTWRHGAPGSWNTPDPSPLPTQCGRPSSVCWSTSSSSSCLVYLSSLGQRASKSLVRKQEMMVKHWRHNYGMAHVQVWDHTFMNSTGMLWVTKMPLISMNLLYCTFNVYNIAELISSGRGWRDGLFMSEDLWLCQDD